MNIFNNFKNGLIISMFGYLFYKSYETNKRINNLENEISKLKNKKKYRRRNNTLNINN
jgi:uncharacterized membrane protein YgaE (UPF0421/DUF939 family)